MSNNLKEKIIWFFIVILLCLLVLFYFKSEALNTAELKSISQGISELKSLDANINRQLFQSHFGKKKYYDDLVNAQKDFVSYYDNYFKQLQKDTKQHLDEKHTSLVSLFQVKEDEIEQFKSHQALLNNSIQYIPHAIDELKNLLNQSFQNKYDQVLANLGQQTSRFLLSKDPIDSKVIEKMLEHIKLQLHAQSTEIEEAITSVIFHLGMIIKYYTEVDELFHKIHTLSIQKQLDQIREEFLFLYEKKEAVANRYKQFMFVLALLLLLIVYYSFRRIQFTSNKLKQTIKDLNFQKYALDQHAIVSTADVKGDITYVNEKFCNISKYSKEELIGKNHNIVKSGFHDDRYFKSMWKTIAKGKVWHGEIKNVNKNGESYWVNSTIVPFLNEKGKPFQYISIRTDISARKNIENQLLQSKQKAEEVSKMKSQFLANMSHEIRTPMNGIIGLTNLALHTKLDEQQKEMIEKAHSSAENLLGIINDILDFSKIESGKLELENISFAIADVIDNLNTIVTLKAEENGILFAVDVDKSLPRVMQGDPLRLGQVLINLASNAIKFTKPGGEVKIAIELEEEKEDSIIIHASVQDTGIGITKAEQSKLFKPFSQTDSSITREFGGTGLGLAISYKLVDKMGGKFWLESEKNVGSTFHFTVKHQKVEDESAIVDESILEEQISLARESLKNAKILLVEDNKVNQLVAKKLLLLYEMNVEIVNNGQEAIDILDTQHFDGVLMDCMMPVKDGYTATMELRKNPRFDSLPIIAMTANAMKGDIEKSIQSGMNDHISKPIKPEVMLMTMAKWIN
ncbi:MAG: response regulator [Gammaproteobacteria bacterium]|nr:response regulator [Gammaproteobacteria bacterium]